VRSWPKGQGIGVLNPNSEIRPTGVVSACQFVLLGVGVTVTTEACELFPPKVARKLAAKRSMSSAATYTCAVPYCAPTANCWVLACALAGVSAKGRASAGPAATAIAAAKTPATPTIVMLRIRSATHSAEGRPAGIPARAASMLAHLF
jgi:hypothetical protein